MAEEETAATVVDAEEPEADNLALVALTPADMPEQQAKLAAWCDRKIANLERELGHWTALMEEAAAGGFKHASYSNGANRTTKRITYYEKIKAAVEGGYLIVPNMPTTTFAVRVKRAKPPRKEHGYDGIPAAAELLPAGEGRYVDDTVFTESETYPAKDYAGKDVERTRYFSTDFDDEVDFPLQGVMPIVLRATRRAMALKLFDQLGVVRNDGGRDPIVVGQLLDPAGNRKLTTFFIAWWLNTATL